MALYLNLKILYDYPDVLSEIQTLSMCFLLETF